MMSPAGAIRAAVPVPPFCPTAPPGAALAGTGAAFPSPAAALPEEPDAADELDALPAEHPARNNPPASMAPPIPSPTAPNRARLIREGRRFELSVFSMPL
jgi:hypothetical protein